MKSARALVSFSDSAEGPQYVSSQGLVEAPISEKTWIIVHGRWFPPEVLTGHVSNQKVKVFTLLIKNYELCI